MIRERAKRRRGRIQVIVSGLDSLTAVPLNYTVRRRNQPLS